eukprot:TRINITY_DN23594_c0_g1_i2.p1 TRINITY_DN23594_c0_g1~~TRINITY_DN23594_c0_g1_i2.p1  ORF type:complete len:243 (-),score=44.96 TRINITY_DN23594_c0_g1_i2:768-1496(-)
MAAVTSCRSCGLQVPDGAACCLDCAPKILLPGPSGDPKDSWQGILRRDGFDIEDAALWLLAKLEEVDNHGGLLEAGSPKFLAAVRRYERCWLPLKEGLQSLPPVLPQPPLDIEWIWILHRLAPSTYHDDCQRLLAGQLPCPRSLPLLGHTDSAAQWAERYGDEPWEAPASEEIAELAAAACCLEAGAFQCQYDFGESAEAQAQFIYQTSRPQFRHREFLCRGVGRYLRCPVGVQNLLERKME